MTDILSPLAYLCGKPTAKAKLKALPEHFQVNEVLGYSLTGHGEHLMVRIRKTGENTSFVANELAKACGVPSRAVSWAVKRQACRYRAVVECASAEWRNAGFLCVSSTIP